MRGGYTPRSGADPGQRHHPGRWGDGPGGLRLVWLRSLPGPRRCRRALLVPLRPRPRPRWARVSGAVRASAARGRGLAANVAMRTGHRGPREGYLAVARRSGRERPAVVGHLCIEPLGPRTDEMAVAVADDWQGRGIGRGLVEAAVAFAGRDPGRHDTGRQRSCLSTAGHDGLADPPLAGRRGADPLRHQIPVRCRPNLPDRRLSPAGRHRGTDGSERPGPAGAAGTTLRRRSSRARLAGEEGFEPSIP